MVFKNFRIQVILRVMLLMATCVLFAWCVVDGYYLRSAYVAAAVAVIVWELIAYVDRFNRDIKTFMVSLMQRDFTTHYQATQRGKSFDELYRALNSISQLFKTISKEKEIQYRYLEMLLEHVRVGILSIDAEGRIRLANQAAKDLLQRLMLTNLASLTSLDEGLVNTLREIRTGETRLVKLRVNQEPLQLSIHASELKLEENYYKLISMQNIRSELDAREMEAWQKLIRVLSHEIMNSVAPVISLSGTLHGLVTHGGKTHIADESLQNALDKGLEAIKIRSEGLYNFTQSYRKLTGAPKVSPKPTNLGELAGRVHLLLQSKLDENTIRLTTTQLDEKVHADPELIEHVLINLLLNAIEAVSGRPQPHIHLWTTNNNKGNLCLHIRDNGEGMDEATAEKIFIPFFTTRKNGSGIGLAITKQILQLHQADIQFSSEKGVGTEFVIVWA
jgi:two-component system, NtrC family, nitrogen regulation sensor histidine kinase NtrY